jgi:hypothetical protein
MTRVLPPGIYHLDVVGGVGFDEPLSLMPVQIDKELLPAKGRNRLPVLVGGSIIVK